MDVIESSQQIQQPLPLHRWNPGRSLTSVIAIASRSIVRWLVEAAALQVWQSRGRNKTVLWHAYDSRHDRSFVTTSEAEMRYWIEQRDRNQY